MHEQQSEEGDMNEKSKVMKVLRLFVLLCVASAVLVAHTNHATMAAGKKFPSRPIAIICPYQPGGGTETELRNLAPCLKKYLGQPVLIKIMPGGGTTIGTSAAARAKPDGYTLVCNLLPATILAQEFHGTDAHLENFDYIYAWYEGPADVTVNAASPYKTFSDLVEASKKKPLKASIAGIGDIAHLQFMLLQKYTGLKATYIPYAGGAPATAAVIRGEVDFFPGASTTSIRFVKAGQIRQLVLLGPEHLEALPDTPTIYELGYKDWPYVPFVRGVSVRPGVPEDRVKILEAAFQKSVDDPDFRGRMQKQGRPVSKIPGKKLQEWAKKSIELAKQYVPLMKETKMGK